MKKRLVKLMLGVVLISVSIVCLNAVIVGNDPLTPFTGNASAQVGDMITDSASELLQSAADAFLFLNEVEIADRKGLDVNSALQRVDMAASRVERAMILFKNIIVTGREAGYEKRRIAQLMDFSYAQFARDNGLNEEMMGEVSSFLGRGNVLGFYRQHVHNLQKLLDTLTSIKGDLLAGRRSDNQVLWSLLQQYNRTLLFGNYASLVFYKI